MPQKSNARILKKLLEEINSMFKVSKGSFFIFFFLDKYYVTQIRYNFYDSNILMNLITKKKALLRIIN